MRTDPVKNCSGPLRDAWLPFRVTPIVRSGVSSAWATVQTSNQSNTGVAVKAFTPVPQYWRASRGKTADRAKSAGAGWEVVDDMIAMYGRVSHRTRWQNPNG